MSKRNVKHKDNLNVEPTWDAAIEDAQQKIKDFRAAIRVYREAKKRGEPWPGTATSLRTQSSSQSERLATQC